VAQVEVVSEAALDESGPGGWTFELQSLDDGGVLRRHRLRLSWADYNHWSRTGSDPPARIAEAVLAFVLSRQAAADVPASFDASSVRRWHPDADDAVPSMIRV
jgi:hypothetical protein